MYRLVAGFAGAQTFGHRCDSLPARVSVCRRKNHGALFDFPGRHRSGSQTNDPRPFVGVVPWGMHVGKTSDSGDSERGLGTFRGNVQHFFNKATKDTWKSFKTHIHSHFQVRIIKRKSDFTRCCILQTSNFYCTLSSVSLISETKPLITSWELSLWICD